jgi:hypothetical protein
MTGRSPNGSYSAPVATYLGALRHRLHLVREVQHGLSLSLSFGGRIGNGNPINLESNNRAICENAGARRGRRFRREELTGEERGRYTISKWDALWQHCWGGRPRPPTRAEYNSGWDMRSRLILAVASAIAGFGFSVCEGLAEQSVTSQSSAVLSHHSSRTGQSPCFIRNPQAGAVRAQGRQSCQDPAASKAAPARQPDLPAFPAAAGRSARSPGAGRASRRPPLRAATGDADLNRHADNALSKRQVGNGGRSVRFKFGAGMGTPQDRLTLEGALSPYQQPNGNTSAATSSSLTSKIQEQGMHFGFELQY